jgi:hypothetical protein
VSNNVVREDEYKNYLWVEGDDDSNVCYHLLKHYQLEKSIEIVDKKGIKHYLDAEAPHAQEVISWIRRLFDLGSA